MDNSLFKEEVYKLYSSFDRTNDYNEIGYLWSFFTYLSELFPNDREIQKMFLLISHKSLPFKKQLHDVQEEKEKEKKNFMKYNRKFFKDFIPQVKNPGKHLPKDLNNQDEKNLVMILEAFLKSVSMDLYNFYLKMIRENRIFLADNSQVAFSSLNNSNTFIFTKKLQNVHDIMIFIHELSHSYYFYLNNEVLSSHEVAHKRIKEEIPSKMIELMFIEFLAKNNLNNTSLALKERYDNSLVYYNKHRNNFDDFKYLIGYYLAYQLIYEYPLEEFFRHVYETDYHDLIWEAREKNMEKIQGKVLVK